MPLGARHVGIFPVSEVYHMIDNFLEFDKVDLFLKTSTKTNIIVFLQDLAANVDPFAGYKVIEMYRDEIIPLEELPVDNQKIVVFDDLVCESNQNSIITF